MLKPNYSTTVDPTVLRRSGGGSRVWRPRPIRTNTVRLLLDEAERVTLTGIASCLQTWKVRRSPGAAKVSALAALVTLTKLLGHASGTTVHAGERGRGSPGWRWAERRVGSERRSRVTPAQHAATAAWRTHLTDDEEPDDREHQQPRTNNTY